MGGGRRRRCQAQGREGRRTRSPSILLSLDSASVTDEWGRRNVCSLSLTDKWGQAVTLVPGPLLTPRLRGSTQHVAEEASEERRPRPGRGAPGWC